MRKLKLSELNRLSVEEFKGSPKLPITLVLDNIRSAHNVGSIFRTADGLAVNRIVLTGITAVPPHKEINKTAIGATESVEWSYVQSIRDIVSTLKEEGNTIIGIEQTDASVSLGQYQFPSTKELVIVMGNEVNGLSEELLPLLDLAIEIPQYGVKHSFNVAVCAGMVLWEMSRQLRSV